MAEVMGDNRAALDGISAGSSIEALAGVAAIVLGILALANVQPRILLAVAMIVLGTGLLVRGAGIAAGFSNLLAAGFGRRLLQGQLGAGAAVELLVGAAGIVLGILALLGIVPEILISVAVIVLGAGVVVGSGTNLGLDKLRLTHGGVLEATRSARRSVRAGSVVQFVVGLIAIILGALALLNIPEFNQLAALALGVGTILAGTAVGGRTDTRTDQHRVRVTTGGSNVQ